ncbi:MAG TPA: ABC transporter permease [Caldithrix abyssi]|uniref:ABC transporter permease n=1 Tax=Caldithrix abyssi TaxID=187145 RepID=A0A7V5PNA7_CALAY|nr:ABC transporter permease [Caldithrix abyssi]
MKNIFRIARWEFKSRIKSRSFLFNTFISPLLFTAVITLPIFFFNYQPEVSTKLIGVIDLSGEKIERQLQRALNRYYHQESRSREYVVMNISVNSSKPYTEMLAEFNNIKMRRDSITALYNQIKDQRTRYYKNTRIPNREYMLRTSYEKLQNTREEKELIEIELERFKSSLDSVYKFEALKIADSLLITNVLNAYLLFPHDFARTGVVEYHSKNPGDLRETERFERILQTIIVEKRMRDDGVQESKIRRWLSPIFIKKYQLLQHGQKEWNFYAQFYGPLIGVFLLFMAIFTAGGYLFSSILLEKSNRVIEILLSYASSRQIMGGKILGLGFLGLVQVLIWLAMIGLLVFSRAIPAEELGYLNATNALYFLIYFSLGFLFYGAIFIAVGSLSSNEYDAQQINQLLRTVAIFPVLLSLIVLAEPNSEWIRILSYIPFLTPSFMIMRIPLSSQPILFDIYLTIGIMLVSILFVILVAGKIFRVATLLQGKKITWAEAWYWLKVK